MFSQNQSDADDCHLNSFELIKRKLHTQTNQHFHFRTAPGNVDIQSFGLD